MPIRKQSAAEVTETVRRIVIEQLGVSPEIVSATAKILEDLGGDSLDKVELVMAIEEEFGIEITDEEADPIETVGGYVDLLLQKMPR